MFFFKTIFSFLKDEEYRDLLYTTFVVIALGTVVYHFLEGWDWLNSLYFSVITLTTIGYGDFSPQTDAGKLFTIFYIIVGVGIILSFINAVFYHFNTARLKENGKEKEDSLGPKNPS